MHIYNPLYKHKRQENRSSDKSSTDTVYTTCCSSFWLPLLRLLPMHKRQKKPSPIICLKAKHGGTRTGMLSLTDLGYVPHSILILLYAVNIFFNCTAN